MARRNSVKLKKMEIKIEGLRTDYRIKVSQAAKKKGKEFDLTMREANQILYNIHTIQKKYSLKAKYGKEHGLPDDLGFKINIE